MSTIVRRKNPFGDWDPSVVNFEADGGAITDAGGYRYHTFTATGVFVVNSPGLVDVLCVGAGGGGASGGGGGGDVVEAFDIQVNASVYPVSVGTGGLPGTTTAFAPGTIGGSSVALGITALGGGGGGGPDGAGQDGASGGGGGASSSAHQAGGSGLVGYAGGACLYHGAPYPAAGGGGAGGVGAPCGPGGNGDGGIGLMSVITGQTYAGGGGGADYLATQAPALGHDGGGDGSYGSPDSGSPNTGGGGGGRSGGGSGGYGGTGLVVVRYVLG